MGDKTAKMDMRVDPEDKALFERCFAALGKKTRLEREHLGYGYEAEKSVASMVICFARHTAKLVEAFQIPQEVRQPGPPGRGKVRQKRRRGR